MEGAKNVLFVIVLPLQMYAAILCKNHRKNLAEYANFEL
jgi:hypothetical protein